MKLVEMNRLPGEAQKMVSEGKKKVQLFLAIESSAKNKGNKGAACERNMHGRHILSEW